MHLPQRGRGAQHPDPSSGPRCLKISSDWAPKQQTMMMKPGSNKLHRLLEIYLALKVSGQQQWRYVTGRWCFWGGHFPRGRCSSEVRFTWKIWRKYEVHFWSLPIYGLDWRFHANQELHGFCTTVFVDQQPINLWNQDVWGRRFERAHRRIDFCMWATRQLHHFCWKWGFRYHQCACRRDQQSRQEVSVFLHLTSSIRSTIGCKVWRDLRGSSGLRWFPGYTRFVLRRSRSCLQWCGKFSFSTISMSVHAESPESSASLLLPVLSVRAMWVVLLRTVMFMCS